MSITKSLEKHLRETLAEYAHDAWSQWMRYLFDQSEYTPDGTVVIPEWAVDRWKRQLSTPYEELSSSSYTLFG